MAAINLIPRGAIKDCKQSATILMPSTYKCESNVLCPYAFIMFLCIHCSFMGRIHWWKRERGRFYQYLLLTLYFKTSNFQPRQSQVQTSLHIVASFTFISPQEKPLFHPIAPQMPSKVKGLSTASVQNFPRCLNLSQNKRLFKMVDTFLLSANILLLNMQQQVHYSRLLVESSASTYEGFHAPM